MAKKSFEQIFEEAESRPEFHAYTRRLELLERIDRKPDRLGGKPCVRGTRLAVEHVLGYLVAGHTDGLTDRESISQGADRGGEAAALDAAKLRRPLGHLTPESSRKSSPRR